MTDWRTIELDAVGIFIGGLSVIGFAAFAVTLPFAILYVVGETIELFTH
jgi:hypothetical protein